MNESCVFSKPDLDCVGYLEGVDSDRGHVIDRGYAHEVERLRVFELLT